MATQADALAAIQRINDATNAQGASLQTVSDNLDKLIAQIGSSVPADVLAGLQEAADHLQLQADFSKALASKGAGDPVPVPEPPAAAKHK